MSKPPTRHTEKLTPTEELELLTAEQQLEMNRGQWQSTESGSISLDAAVENENGTEGTIGTEFVGYDPWGAIDEQLDATSEGRLAEPTEPQLRHFSPPRDHARDTFWDRPTLIAHGSKTAPPHPFRDDPHRDQFEQAHGTSWRRKPASASVADPILVKLFECITTAVRADVALAAAGKRGRPTALDQPARMLTAVAVQGFRLMGYTSTAIAQALSLPLRTVSRYMNPELLPVLSPDALERIFGGSNATPSSEADSSPASDIDATRRRGVTTPAPASPPHGTFVARRAHTQMTPDPSKDVAV
jgi:hypothetical protein